MNRKPLVANSSQRHEHSASCVPVPVSPTILIQEEKPDSVFSESSEHLEVPNVPLSPHDTLNYKHTPDATENPTNIPDRKPRLEPILIDLICPEAQDSFGPTPTNSAQIISDQTYSSQTGTLPSSIEQCGSPVNGGDYCSFCSSNFVSTASCLSI